MFAEAYEAALAKVADGALIASAKTDDGFYVRIQRADHNNSRRSRVVVHVWKGARLMRKSEWHPLLCRTAQ